MFTGGVFLNVRSKNDVGNRELYAPPRIPQWFFRVLLLDEENFCEVFWRNDRGFVISSLVVALRRDNQEMRPELDQRIPSDGTIS